MAAAWTWLWWTHGSPSPHHPAIFDALDPWLLANHTVGKVVELPQKHLAPVAVGAADHQVEPRWGFWIRQHGDVWDLAQCALWWHSLGSGLGLGFRPGHSCRGGRLGLRGATLVHLALLGHIGLGRGLAHGGDWGAGQKAG